MPNSSLVSLYSAKHATPHRTAHVSQKAKNLNVMLRNKLSELSTALGLTFSFDKFSINDFKEYLLPTALTTAGMISVELGGNYLNAYAQQDLMTFVKLAVSLGVLLNSASHHISESEIVSTTKKTLCVASEMLAVIYLYQLA